jgi:hypothetical protein
MLGHGDLHLRLRIAVSTRAGSRAYVLRAVQWSLCDAIQEACHLLTRRHSPRHEHVSGSAQLLGPTLRDKERDDFGIMFFVWVVGVAKIVIHRDGFDDTVDSLLAKCSDAWRDDGEAAEQVLTQFIVERANAFGPGIHG